MDTLPVEVTTKIIAQLKLRRSLREPPPSLVNYALVCTKWQHIAERYTFANLQVKSTALDVLASSLGGDSNAHRRAILRRVELVIVLPPHSHRPWIECSKDERRAEKHRNNLAVVEAFDKFFSILDTWPEQERHLTLRSRFIHSIEDKNWPRCEVKVETPTNISGVMHITHLELDHSKSHNVQPASLASFASKMPNLENLKLTYSDTFELHNSVDRRRRRYNLAKQLRLINHSSLQHIEIISSRTPLRPSDQTLWFPSIIHPGSTFDDLSRSLHHLSQLDNLQTIRLGDDTMISSELFWPHQKPSIEPYWPSLNKFFLSLNLVSPEGGWYFVKDPNPPLEEEEEEDEDDMYDGDNYMHDEWEPSTSAWQHEESLASELDFSDDASEPPTDTESEKPDYKKVTRLFRVWPSEKLEVLLIAMARAVARMPALKWLSVGARIETKNYHRNGRKFQITYFAPGEVAEAPYQEEDRTKPRLYWNVPTGWRMNKDLEQLWKVKLGENGIISYSEW